VQDDQDDWLRESATMGQVYGLSTCTIAATLGGNGDDGCFTTRNQCKVRPCKIPNPFDKTSSLRFYARSQYIGEIYRREVKQSPWYRRGWVFQERTLSPRLLIFGKTQMLWACQKLHAAETWPCGATSEDYIDRFESFEVHKSRLRTLLDKDQIISPWDTTWYIFIFSYTRSHLTRMSDRLIALQGLASQIASVTDRQYCAGLWIDKTLPLSLLWNAYRPNTQRSEEYRAPTWSWASIDGSIGFKQIAQQLQTTARITIDIHGTEDLPDHQRHISRVPLANLKLSGRLTPVNLYCLSSTGPLKLQRTNSKVPLEDLAIAKLRDILPVLLIILPFVGIILPILALIIKSSGLPHPNNALIVALMVFCIAWVLLVAILPYRRYVRVVDRTVTWLSQPFKYAVRSPSGLSDPIPEGPLYAKCTSDTPLRHCSFDAFCLPVLKGKAEYDGLLLKAAARGEGYYERVGTFARPNPQLMVMLESAPQVSFVLT
jgi:hypothetical protein